MKTYKYRFVSANINLLCKLFKIKRKLIIKNCNVVLTLDKTETFTFFLPSLKENSLIPDIKNSLKIIKIEGSNIKVSVEHKNNKADEVKILSDIGSNTFP